MHLNVTTGKGKTQQNLFNILYSYDINEHFK